MKSFRLTTEQLISWIESKLVNVHCPQMTTMPDFIIKIIFSIEWGCFYSEDEIFSFRLTEVRELWKSGMCQQETSTNRENAPRFREKNTFSIVNPEDVKLYGNNLTGATIEITNRGKTFPARLQFDNEAYSFIATPVSNFGQPMIVSIVNIIKLSQGHLIPDLAKIDNLSGYLSANLLKLADV